MTGLMVHADKMGLQECGSGAFFDLSRALQQWQAPGTFSQMQVIICLMLTV